MSHFYGGVHGNRGEATRLGTARSGIRAFAQGGRSGVRVYGSHAADVERDYFDVYATSGSNGGAGGIFLGRVQVADAGDGLVHFYPSDEVRAIVNGGEQS